MSFTRRRSFKDMIESFDDLFPCSSHGPKCRFRHIFNWLYLFWPSIGQSNQRDEAILTVDKARVSNLNLRIRASDNPAGQLPRSPLDFFRWKETRSRWLA